LIEQGSSGLGLRESAAKSCAVSVTSSYLWSWALPPANQREQLLTIPGGWECQDLLQQVPLDHPAAALEGNKAQ